MSWYVHPSRQLRDDELPPELVVTNRDGSIVQVYVPYDATGEQLKAENAKLREMVDELYPLADYGAMDASELDRAHDLMRELGMHDLMRELGIEAG